MTRHYRDNCLVLPKRESQRVYLARLFLAIFACGAPLAVAAEPVPCLVFAAASLKNALDDAASRWQAAGGAAVKVSYAGSSALARQIEQGAPADVFISANLEWVDYLAVRGLVVPASRRVLLGNKLVLVAPASQPPPLLPAGTLWSVDPWLTALSDGRLAMANIDAVPAGQYGKAALQSLGVWPALESRVAQAMDVRGALAFVARGEAPLGIVYASDARAEPKVRVVAVFPESSHPPVRYAAARVASSTNPDAARFLEWLSSEAARPAFEAEGFTFLPER